MISEKSLSSVIEEMKKKNINAVHIYDDEEHRESNLYYLTGHPTDSTALILDNGNIYLFPWDIILAERANKNVKLVDLNSDFKGSLATAMKSIIHQENYDPDNFVVEVDPKCSLKKYEFLKSVFNEKNIKYSTVDSFWNFFDSLRKVKSAEELVKMRNIADITNKVIDQMRGFILNKGKSLREVDLAIFVENQGRFLGADALSFETLCANTKRSWAIHCYPAVTDSILTEPGLALIDFGFKKDGYCSDVTVPMVFEPINKIQEKIVKTVVKAHDECIGLIAPGVKSSHVYNRATELIKSAGLPSMPHGLGHGLGLDCHDPGALKPAPKKDAEPGRGNNCEDYILEEGFIVTVEPGIYHPEHGGCRFEDDVVVTTKGSEVLTKSRLLRFSSEDLSS